MKIVGIPFELTTKHPESWSFDESTSTLNALALPHSDFYINPAGGESIDAESLSNATTLLGTPPSGDFQFISRINVGFKSLFDAGVLMIWIDETHWVKFCFEFSPAKKPMVVSVLTSGLSDDSNAFTVDGEEIWYRIARQGHVYALHSSFDGIAWELIRVFSLGLDTSHHLLGFEAQSPTGDGCAISFDQIQFKSERLIDFRDGS